MQRILNLLHSVEVFVARGVLKNDISVLPYILVWHIFKANDRITFAQSEQSIVFLFSSFLCHLICLDNSLFVVFAGSKSEPHKKRKLP